MNEPDHALSVRTTPTWEVELLISGVAVFAMLQLPGQLDDALFALEPRLDGNWRQLAVLTYVYAKSAALILAITFVLHLLLRARWIALSGMHSVYPEGIRWDKLKFGPILHGIELARSRPLPEIIERADNRSSVVFAIGVMMAQMMIAIALGAAAAFLVALLLHSVTGLDVPTWLVLLFSLVMLPYVASVFIDRTFASRMPEGSRPRRIVHGVLDAYARIGFSRSSNPVMALLASRDGDRKTMMLTTGLMLLSLLGVGASMVMVAAPERFGSYSMFPRGDAVQSGIDGAHYDDQRDPLHDGGKPYIQGLVVTTPYVKLVVPYQPRRDETAMRASCAHADALAMPEQAKARLACLSALHPVSLDGKPLPGLRYEIASDPRADRPALLAMIDVRALAPGRHELQVARPPRSGKSNKDDPGFDRIPFWR